MILVEEAKGHEIEDAVMVSHTDCVGLCTMGPVVMIYPEQTWHGNVTPDDAEEVLDALEKSETVKRLEI